jgi:hypothetical protein
MEILNMTMILTCLTKDYVVQASDRRLTRAIGRKVEVIEDHSNKALIYSNHFTFAYTGLAKLPLKSAIDWAAQALSERENLGDAIWHLGNRASDLMISSLIRNFYLRSPTHIKRLAFVGAGFADIEEDGRRKPISLRIVISNFFSGQDCTWLTQPRDVFEITYTPLPEDLDFELFVAGAHIPQNRQNQLNRILTRCIRNKVKPEIIGRLLTREIQMIAKLNETVGKNIMCTMIPRPHGDSTSNLTYRFGAIELKRPVISTEPQHLEPVEDVSDQYRFVILPPFDTPVFVYIPGDGKAFPYYGPVLVGPRCIVTPVTIDSVSITVPRVDPAPDH